MRYIEIEEEKVLKQREFCHNQICYWEDQYRKAKEKGDTFYQKCYWRQINRWQAQYEILGWLLVEGEQVDKPLDSDITVNINLMDKLLEGVENGI